jgi:hypothetical protein
MKIFVYFVLKTRKVSRGKKEESSILKKINAAAPEGRPAAVVSPTHPPFPRFGIGEYPFARHPSGAGLLLSQGRE